MQHLLIVPCNLLPGMCANSQKRGSPAFHHGLCLWSVSHPIPKHPGEIFLTVPPGAGLTHWPLWKGAEVKVAEVITVLRVAEFKYYLASEFCFPAGKAVFQQQASRSLFPQPNNCHRLTKTWYFIASVVSKYKSHALSAMLLTLSLYHMQQHISFVRNFLIGQWILSSEKCYCI